MKLFLCSQTITAKLLPYFITLVGKQPTDVTIAFIENGADVEKGSKTWAAQNRQAIEGHGFDVEVVDLHKYSDNKAGLAEKFASKDVIWLGGGNTFYLRWLLYVTGADEIITELVRQGTVYGGSSAGAVVAGPTLKHFEAADDPAAAPELILTGLNFTDTVVVPHIDNPGFLAVIHNINDKLKVDGYTTTPLTDAQALIVNGDEQQVV
jgi:dipeptidase E